MMLSIRHDHTGAVFAEFAILLPIVVFIVCGSIDFLYAFYQLNAAAKATEVGRESPLFPIRWPQASTTCQTRPCSMASSPEACCHLSP